MSARTLRNKHTRPSPPRFAVEKPVLHFLIVAGALIVVGLILFIISNGSASQYVPQVTGRANAEPSRTVIDHGDVLMEQTVESVYRIRNTGDQPLILNGEPRVELVQGCCPPRAIVSAYTIQPGEETVIRMRYTMHDMMGGPHEFRVHVLTNDPTQPDIVLVDLSNWVES